MVVKVNDLKNEYLIAYILFLTQWTVLALAILVLQLTFAHCQIFI